MSNPKVIQEKINALQFNWSRKKKYPRGTVNMGANEVPVILTETLKLPVRVGIAGYDTHVFGMPGIHAHESEFNGIYLVENEMGKSNKSKKANGNFDTWIRNLNFELNYRCHGILFRGAQKSGIMNCRINLSADGKQSEVKIDPYNGEHQYGINSASGGRNQTFSLIDVVGYYSKKNIHKTTGIKLNAIKGASGNNNSWHKLSYGLEFDSCRTVRLVNQWFELTHTPVAIYDGSQDIEISGMMVRRSSDILADFSGKSFDKKPAKGNIKLTGIVHVASEKTCWYIDRNGNKVRATREGGNAKKESGEYFNIEI